MEKEPNIKEIFYALTGEATYSDWDRKVLNQATSEKTKKVISLLEKGLPFSEAEIEIEEIMKGGEKN